jgi:hypothetical protein
VLCCAVLCCALLCCAGLCCAFSFAFAGDVGNVDLDEFSILQRKLRHMYRHAKDPGRHALPNSPRQHRATTDQCVRAP